MILHGSNQPLYNWQISEILPHIERKALQNRKLNQWLEEVYATQGEEWGCTMVQSMLPSFVEAKVGIEEAKVSSAVQEHIAVHLQHCPDCSETFEALFEVVQAELNGELPSAEVLLAQIAAEQDQELHIAAD